MILNESLLRKNGEGFLSDCIIGGVSETLTPRCFHVYKKKDVYTHHHISDRCGRCAGRVHGGSFRHGGQLSTHGRVRLCARVRGGGRLRVGAFGLAAPCVVCKRCGAVGSIVRGYLRKLPCGRDDHGRAAVFNAGAGADGGIYRDRRRLCARQPANLGAVGL